MLSTNISIAPVVLFAYNRPQHLKLTIDALLANSLAKESEIFIFSDAPKTEKDTENVRKVRNILHELHHKTENSFKKTYITYQPKNIGLAQSIISGVSLLLAQYPAVIVMEDDLVCSSDFLQFMNESLQKYASQTHIFSISGYRFPIKLPSDFKDDAFLMPRASSWGWATWADRWAYADWEVKGFEAFWQDKTAQNLFNQGGEDLSLMLYKQQKGVVSSWAIRWCYTLFIQKAFCLYPLHSKIQNIGNDNSGTNSGNTTKYTISLKNTPYILPDFPKEHINISKKLRTFFRPSFLRKIINWLKFGYWRK